MLLCLLYSYNPIYALCFILKHKSDLSDIIFRKWVINVDNQNWIYYRLFWCWHNFFILKINKVTIIWKICVLFAPHCITSITKVSPTLISPPIKLEAQTTIYAYVYFHTRCLFVTYSKTCLQWNLDQTEPASNWNLSLTENVYSPGGLNSWSSTKNYLYEMELACSKIFWRLASPLYAGFTTYTPVRIEDQLG
jgi:hypothetical protein